MKEPGKRHYVFELNGQPYSGHIVSSTAFLPHFHWFMFEDPDIISQYGDSIAFKVEDNKLIPLYHLTAPDLVAAVQACVQQYLEESQSGNE